MYSPDTEVYLLNTPFTIDGEHQLVFAGKTDQYNYFNSLSKLYLTGFTYQRKDNIIKVGLNVEQLYKYNYVMYRNSHFSDKYFYAYITKLEYVSEKLTHIHIKTDVFQTWYFDLKFNKSFIERQHSSIDEYNTINDTVAHGQLVESKSITKSFSGGYFVFCTSDITRDNTTESMTYDFTVGDYNIPCWVLFWKESEASSMSMSLQGIANHGWGDRILSAVYVPFITNVENLNIVDYESGVDSIGTIHICKGLTPLNIIEVIDFDFSQVVDFKKSLTYPYSKIVVSDMTTGQSIELAPEKFQGTIAQFQIQCSISETPTYKIIPKNYDGQLLAFNEALVTRCSTTLPTSNNSYAKYMMMSGEMNTLRRIESGVGIAGAVLGRSPMGVITGVEQIINVTAQENQASKLPNQVTSLSDGAMERLNFQNGIKISLFTMDNFHMEVANNYWKMCGYPIHSLDEPVLNSGGNFNYIKMISPNIEGGSIPQDDMMEIEGIFSKGVTLWHNTENYRKY